MNRPAPSSRPLAALALTLAFVLSTLAIAVLSVLTLGFAGVVFGIALLLAGFIALNYLVWGRWLSDYILRQQAEEEEQG